MAVEVEQQAIGIDRLPAQKLVNVLLKQIAQAHLASNYVAQARQGGHRDLASFQRVENVVATLARKAG